jgi:phage recombination protein Bet
MTDSLVVTEPAAPPVVSTEQLELIRRTIAKDASEPELQLFLYDCSRRGIHPLDRLLHFSKRGGKYTPIVSIDFMRQRAAATGACAGIDDATFSGTPKAADFAASVTVWRFVQAQKCRFTATARWAEYKPDQDWMWLRMPHLMLGKTAEALALRRAFPTELAGVYVVEELEQAENGQPAIQNGVGDAVLPRADTNTADSAPARARPAPEPLTDKQRGKWWAEANRRGWTIEELKAELLRMFSYGSPKELQQPDFAQWLDAIQRRPVVNPDDLM